MEPTVATLVDLFRGVHAKFREMVRDMDSEQLNWSPAPDTNSVAVLITHTLGSELDTLLFVRDIQGDRDRDSEFRATASSASSLLAALDLADELLGEHGENLTSDQLVAVRERPNRDPQTGLYWLLSNYGHAKEHLGHLELTNQLYARQATA
jgi:hypothetical protein